MHPGNSIDFNQLQVRPKKCFAKKSFRSLKNKRKHEQEEFQLKKEKILNNQGSLELFAYDLRHQMTPYH